MVKTSDFESDAAATDGFVWHTIDTAKKDSRRPVLLYSDNQAGDGNYVVGIWYFGGWASCHPILGDPIGFEPTHWKHLDPPAVHPSGGSTTQ